MSAIPPFDSDGLLASGDYEVSFDELRNSALVLGSESPIQAHHGIKAASDVASVSYRTLSAFSRHGLRYSR